MIRSYLINQMDWGEIHIGGYTIEGAVCHVNYYTDSSRHYREVARINIWEMLEFMFNDK